MTDFLNLRSGVGPGEPNNEDDVRAAKKSLTGLGFTPFNRPFRDFEVPASEIEDLQIDRELKVDGIMKPGGETEQTVNKEMLKKRTRDRRTLNGLFGDPDIENPVGADDIARVNKRQDLIKAEDALTKAGEPPRNAPMPTPSMRGLAVAEALRRFQANAGLKADGLMNPGGPTQAALRDKLAENGLAAPPQEVANRATGPGSPPNSPAQPTSQLTPPPGAFEKKNVVPKTARSRSERPVPGRKAADLDGLERHGIFEAAGLSYRPDAFGRFGQGTWVDAEGREIGRAQLDRIVNDALAREAAALGRLGLDREALFVRAGFSNDADSGLWLLPDGDVVPPNEAERLAFETVRFIERGGMRAEDTPLVLGVVDTPQTRNTAAGLIWSFLSVLFPETARRTEEEARRRQEAGRNRQASEEPLPSNPPPQEALPPEKPKPPRDFDKEKVKDVMGSPPGRPTLPPDMPPTPGFEPADLPNLIEILPDDRENLPQFIILTANQFGRPGGPDVRAGLQAILDATNRELELLGFELKHKAGGPLREKKLKNRRNPNSRSGHSFPDLWLKHQRTGRRLFINTVTTLTDGETLTVAEFHSGVRLAYNLEEGDFLLVIPKFGPGQLSESEFRRFVRPILEELDRDVPRSSKEIDAMAKRVIFEWRTP